MITCAGHWNAPVMKPGAKNSKIADSSTASTFTDGRSFPVIIFSHGLAGQRNSYSSICLEMASWGFVVLTIEHADGSASVARLAGPSRWEPWQRESRAQDAGRWRWYRGENQQQLSVLVRHSDYRFLTQGLGGESSMWTKRTEWRAQEVQMGLRLLTQLNKGDNVKEVEHSHSVCA